MVNATLDINFGDFERGLVDELKRQVQLKLIYILNRITPEVKAIIKLEFYSSSHYLSLLGGELMVEMGLDNADSDLKTIIDAIIMAMKIKLVTKNERTYLGGIEIGAFRQDFVDALSASGAKYTSTSSRGSTVVEWLSWLLFAGDEVVIDDFGIYYGVNISQWSRTGHAIMVKRGKSKKLKAWRVPTKYSGIESHNWLTKVADSCAKPVLDLLEKEIKREFNV